MHRPPRGVFPWFVRLGFPVSDLPNLTELIYTYSSSCLLYVENMSMHLCMCDQRQCAFIIGVGSLLHAFNYAVNDIAKAGSIVSRCVFVALSVCCGACCGSHAVQHVAQVSSWFAMFEHGRSMCGTFQQQIHHACKEGRHTSLMHSKCRV